MRPYDPFFLSDRLILMCMYSFALDEAVSSFFMIVYGSRYGLRRLFRNMRIFIGTIYVNIHYTQK
jgi:hypothetical protein